VHRFESRLYGAGDAARPALRAKAGAEAVSWAVAESAEAGALAGLAGGGHRARVAGDRVDAAAAEAASTESTSTEAARTEAARAEGGVGLLAVAVVQGRAGGAARGGGGGAG